MMTREEFEGWVGDVYDPRLITNQEELDALPRDDWRIVVSPSMIGTAQRCVKRAVGDARGIKRMRAPLSPALSVGTVLHDAIDALHQGFGLDEVRERAMERIVETIAEAEGMGQKATKFEQDMAWLERTLPLVKERMDREPHVINASEKTLGLWLPLHGVLFVGTPDQIVEWNGLGWHRQLRSRDVKRDPWVLTRQYARSSYEVIYAVMLMLWLREKDVRLGGVIFDFWSKLKVPVTPGEIKMAALKERGPRMDDASWARHEEENAKKVQRFKQRVENAILYGQTWAGRVFSRHVWTWEWEYLARGLTAMVDEADVLMGRMNEPFEDLPMNSQACFVYTPCPLETQCGRGDRYDESTGFEVDTSGLYVKRIAQGEWVERVDVRDKRPLEEEDDGRTNEDGAEGTEE